jgi:hypothetical protein
VSLAGRRTMTTAIKLCDVAYPSLRGFEGTDRETERPHAMLISFLATNDRASRNLNITRGPPLDSLIPSNNHPDSNCLSVGNHRLEISRTESGATIRLLGPDGTQPLEIDIGPSGPVLRLRAGLSIAIEGPIAIGGDMVSIRARREMSLHSDGNLSLSASGRLTCEAAAHTIVARDRDVIIDANDDVVVNGERIRLNG